MDTKKKRKESTVADIAKALGVSTASVSRALSGQPGVRESLREEILEYCSRIGYKHEPVKVRQKVVAVIVGDIRNPFYASLVFTIQQRLAQQQYLTIVYNSEYDVDKEVRFIRSADKYGLSGLILITATEERITEALEERGMPKVLVNRNLINYDGSSVLNDNYQAGYEAALYLIGLGHRKIAFMRGPINSSASELRYEGYCQAMRNYGYDIPDEYIKYCDYKIESGREVGAQYLRLKDRPTAIISVSDIAALGIMDACRDLGVEIPRDLSVLGFDNIEVGKLHQIGLTSFDQHEEEMGSIAVDLLLKQFADIHCEKERIIMKPRLLERGSTAAPLNAPNTLMETVMV